MGKEAVADESFLLSASDQEKEYIARGGNVLVREQDGREEPYSSVGRDSYALMLGNCLQRTQGRYRSFRGASEHDAGGLLTSGTGDFLARVLHLDIFAHLYGTSVQSSGICRNGMAGGSHHAV